MEPTDFDFRSRHDWFDSQGTLLPSHPSKGDLMSRSTGKDSHFSHRSETSEQSSILRSILDEEGINVDVDELFGELPERYAKGSAKAKATWFGTLCLAGVGIFFESFVIITTGQIKTIWHDQYPECWAATEDMSCPESIDCCGLFPNTPLLENGTCVPQFPDDCKEDGTFPDDLTCSKGILDAVSYSEFAGIMFGMVLFGVLGDKIGRKSAGALTSLCMFLGITIMTFFKSDNISSVVLAFAIFFGIFGVGVGGEYPLTATGAAAQHAQSMEDAQFDDADEYHRHLMLDAAKTARRGETISLIFAMQGIGAVVGSLFLLILIYFSGQTRTTCGYAGTNASGNDPQALNTVWRSYYFIGWIFIVMLFLYRSLVLEEDTGFMKVAERRKRREEKYGRNATSTVRMLKFYFPRLVGTGGCWLVMNVSFYGLKLFSGPIFAAINAGGDLVVNNGWLLFNNVCALAGYYASAAAIDRPLIGRRRLQMASFAACTAVFMITAAIFNSGKTQTVMFLFFAGSFLVNFGANVTTYVMAAETYPTEFRGTCHGLSAFLGKFGALLATVSFPHLSNEDIFWICGAVSLLGLVITYVFSVDLTHVSLTEHDAQLEFFLEGRPGGYRGLLNAPQHLSNFEKWTGRHGQYDPKWLSKSERKRYSSFKKSSGMAIVKENPELGAGT